MTEEILNIRYNHKVLVLKALNRNQNTLQAAKALGISERHLYNIKKNLNIEYIKKENRYGEIIQGPGIAKEV